MTFRIPALISCLWRRIGVSRPALQSRDPENSTIDELLAAMEAATPLDRSKIKQEEEAFHQAALAAAAAGEGPQPWDRDWYERSTDFYDEIYNIGHWGGWHCLQELIEVLDWALASPKGLQAQALAGMPSNPWQGELDLIAQMRRDLVHVSGQLLQEQAEKLRYPGQRFSAD